MQEKISRREFLKIFGASGLGLALGGLGAISFLKDIRQANNKASAQSYGSWQLGGQTHATAVHASMLHDGKILYVAGSGFYSQNELGPFQLGRYDTATDTAEPLPSTSEDMFCVGHTQLPNGNILLAGGTLSYNSRSANGKWLGLNKAWIYDVPSNTVRPTASMSHGRWYPTLLTLADGKVLVVAGWDEYGVQNKLAEIFDPATETWSIKYDPLAATGYCVGEGQDPAVMPGAGQPCYGPGVAPNVLLYPRMHLLPSGLVAFCGQMKTLRTFNPATGVWKFAGNMLFGASRGYGSSVLLPLQNTPTEKGSILIFGGTATDDSFATTSAEILTPSGTALQPRWTNPSQFGRKHPIPVIMPDGKILVIGGTAYQNSGANKIMEAELFDPVTEAWTTLPAMTVPRQYHSTALLLADGRVWTAGTTYSLVSRELRVEYFVPSYYSAARPTISGNPVVGSYGETITVPTPEGLDVDSVSLVAMSTETHAYNCDQRLVWLQIQSKTASEVVVSAPINANIAPPGYYYLHVLKGGIPSVAAIIRIPGDVLVPPDTTLPTLSIMTPTPDQILTGPEPGLAVNVTGTAADDVGLQVVEVSVDSGPFAAASGTGSWSFTTQVLGAGPHVIAARAKDNAGNISLDSTVNITIEVTPSGGAFVSIYSVAGSNSYGTMFSTGGIAQGEVLTPSSSLIGSAIKRVAVILKKAGNTTGPIYLRVRNSSSVIVKEFGTIDAAALTAADQRFELTAASSYLLQANDRVLVEWAGTGSSADVVHVKRTGADAFNGTNTHYITRNASGSYSNSTSRDLAGDWYYQSSTPADSTPPTITIETPASEEVLTGPSPSFAVNVTGTASDDAGGGLELVEVSIDGGAFSAATGTNSWTFATAPLAAGPHTINARAKDNAGNMSDVAVRSFTIEVTVPTDTVLPTISIVSPANNGTLTGPAPSFAVDVTGTAADAESGLQLVEVSVDAGEFAPATGTGSWSFTTAPLTEGAHVINARAKDVAGNTSDIATVNITIQVTAPGTFVSIYSVAGSNSYGTTFSTGSSTDTTGQGEKILPASSLVGTAVKRVAVILKKAGNTTGSINVRIRKGSDDSVAMEIGSLDASVLTTADQRFELTASSTYTLQANDKVLVEWAGTGSSADVVHVKRSGVDAFNGTNTYFVSRKVNGSYANSTTRDLAGDWYYEV